MTDSSYDDGSEVEVTTDEEDPPSSGTWIDSEEFFENPTEDELAMGQLLGEKIDVDDDEDNGSEVIKAIEELNR